MSWLDEAAKASGYAFDGINVARMTCDNRHDTGCTCTGEAVGTR